MTYRNTILATAILFLALATGLLTAPGVFATTFRLEPLQVPQLWHAARALL